ncbi:hypothetical protein DSECCO2_615580 [anaerobic digester metagenome]
MEFAHHPGYIHHDAPGTQDGKVRPEPERDDRFSRVLPDQPVMDLTRCLARRREREPVSEDLHIEHEEMGTVRQHPSLDMGYDGPHLLLDRLVRLLDKQVDELLVALRVPAEVQDILDDLPPIAEPEPELLVIERERDITTVVRRVIRRGKSKVPGTLRRLAPVAGPCDRRQVPDLALDRRIDQAGDLCPQHPGRDAVIPAHVVGVDVPDQVVVHDRVRMVVVHDQHRKTVDPGDLQRRHILLGRPVIHQEDHRHLLPVADVILEGEVDIPRDILDLIERRFGWRPLEEEVLRIEVSARLPDQCGHRLLDRDGSTYPIRIRVMPENDRPRGQDRLPDLLCHKAHLRPER